MPPFTFSILLLCLLTFLSTFANATQSQPSVSSSCFACPSVDTAPRTLKSYTQSASDLICTYEDTPHDYYCTYYINNVDATKDGTLDQDADKSKCPPTAVNTLCARRRNENNPVEILKRRVNARAAQPQASRPEYMGVRSKLRRNKRADNGEQ